MKIQRQKATLLAASAVLAGTVLSWGGPAANAARHKHSYVNPTGDEFPILAYHALPSHMVNAGNFRILADCGFNMALNWLPDTTYVSKSLELAKEYGIKLLINTPQTRKAAELPELMRQYDGFSSTAGYLLWDEPVYKQFEQMKEQIEAVRKTNPGKLAYVNLLPNYARADAYGTKDYREYLELFIKIAEPEIISFDNYCIYEEKGELKLRPNYFENMETVREVTQAHDLPFWSFCLSTAHYSYPVPDEAQLSFEAFMGLAYGSKCIQYYGYATNAMGPDTLTTAPVAQDGKRRKVWYAIQKVNNQLKTIGKLLLPCRSVGVWHTGLHIPEGTRKLQRADLPYPFSSVVSGPAGVVVSHLKDSRHNYLLIVNKDFERSQRVSIKKEKGVNRIDAAGQKSIDNRSRITLRPGGWYLYTW